jgi:tetratricopeptide (TPR) repeat protein
MLVLASMLPAVSHAQYFNTTSMEVFSANASEAKECYRSASIAARIHYTSRRDLDNCNFALDHTALSLRDRAATFANRGIVYMAMEDYQRAIQDFTTAMRLRPDFGEINVNMGNVYYVDKSFAKAIAEYTTALEKKTSREFVAYLNRGMAYENLGDYDKAEADYRSAQEIMPDWVLPQLRLEQLARKRNG